ncbi:PTS mannitol transporter subunit IICBA [Propionimicrobium sp. PCR01-08-3]|uniref:PTS mannitol transporter subunit IICBA n=1 Tax=Propionimicrobium sp. PCR01-08-3 TaxID=3052086 RepID=UPI00255CD882|nr:PTS mannitol transporter subunit IICBA [Propionimicrobium sp. PCR01-08-3]WIY82282.1 PTS mannitol transporter subunit IICBA [Propionimicrobium sp. PCR01-08-3]
MSLPDARVNKNLEGPGARARIQKFGGFLAGMIMPNIGAFIAWGLITALFIETGWIPNEKLATLVDPMIKYLLPLLIGYTGGKTVHGTRGAVIGAVATMGVVIGSDVPMFLGAMIMGPLAAWLLKKLDNALEGHIPSGFEMLIDNFSLGILGMILAILGGLGIGPVVGTLMAVLASGVGWLVNNHLLPLASVIVEPAKVLFLNNAINHGILTPLGIEQAKAAGSSILFMVESNPGPGLGLLLAFWVAGTKKVRQSVPGAVIIHLFGGIHEIFFPYVLMKPKTILATIAGAMSGLFVGGLLGAGLVGPASPGSILAWFIMTPRGGYLPMIVMFLVATAVSFAVAYLLIRGDKKKDEAAELEAEGRQADAAGQAVAEAEAGGSTASVLGSDVSKVIIACDAGMGSSVMVASQMKKKLAPYGIEVAHTPVDQIPADAQVVLTHEGLAARAIKTAPNSLVVPFSNYMGDPAFTRVEEAIRDGRRLTATGISGEPVGAAVAAGAGRGTATAASPSSAAAEDIPEHVVDVEVTEEPTTSQPVARKRKTYTLAAGVLPRENVRLGLASVSKEEAIRQAGQVLVDNGAADPQYIEGMIDRESEISTLLGEGIAIPHGTNAARAHVKHAALGFLQFPDGIDWDGKPANLVIPIASNSDEHVGVLAALATTLADPAKAERLRAATDVDEVIDLLTPENEE